MLVPGLLALAQHGMLYVLVYRDVAGSLLAGGGELHTVVIAAFALALRLLAFVVAAGLPAVLVLAALDALSAGDEDPVLLRVPR